MAEEKEKQKQKATFTDAGMQIDIKDAAAIERVKCQMAEHLPTPATIMYEVSGNPEIPNTYGYTYDDSFTITQGGLTIHAKGRPTCEKKTVALE